MVEGFGDTLVWILRLGLIVGLAWGGWLCIGELLPARSEKTFQLEHFATFALLVLVLITTLGGFAHAG